MGRINISVDEGEEAYVIMLSHGHDVDGPVEVHLDKSDAESRKRALEAGSDAGEQYYIEEAPLVEE